MSIFNYHSPPNVYYSLKKVYTQLRTISVINMNTHIII